MRLILFISFYCFCYLCFGQDSLQIDTSHKTFISTTQDSLFADSASSTLNKFPVRKKKSGKKVQKFKIKNEPATDKDENTQNIGADEKYNVFIIAGIIFIAIAILLSFVRSIFYSTSKLNTTNPKDEGVVSDYLARLLLSRRDYYRNVYLKSEAWQRKRYLVLKRDNWRCVYCGGQATQVHHTRYAKRNIGKEPIEWLVSICKTCHDSKHN